MTQPALQPNADQTDHSHVNALSVLHGTNLSTLERKKSSSKLQRFEAREVLLSLPHPGSPTFLKSTCWVCGTNPSSLNRQFQSDNFNSSTLERKRVPQSSKASKDERYSVFKRLRPPHDIAGLRTSCGEATAQIAQSW